MSLRHCVFLLHLGFTLNNTDNSHIGGALLYQTLNYVALIHLGNRSQEILGWKTNDT